MAVAIGYSGIRCGHFKEDVTDRPIKASVGQGGANQRHDTVIVQQLLNGVPVADGGPSPPLAVDGIVGPKTNAAIRGYQKRLMANPDGRVDPGGPTICALTQFICTSPSVPKGAIGPNAPTSGAASGGDAEAELKKKLVDGLTADELAKLCVSDANDRLEEVLPSLNVLSWKLTHINNTRLALFQKHFGTDKEKVTDTDILHVRKVISDCFHYGYSFRGFIEYDPVLPKGVLAYTVRGGDKLALKKFQIYKDVHNKFRVHKYPGQTVWVTDLYIAQHRLERVWTMLHEMAHFVGKRDGHFDVIDDHGYAFEGHYQKLSKFRRLHNAETLSMFMLDCCYGTDALTALPRITDKLTLAIKPPFVLPDGSVVMQK